MMSNDYIYFALLVLWVFLLPIALPHLSDHLVQLNGPLSLDSQTAMSNLTDHYIQSLDSLAEPGARFFPLALCAP